MISYILLFGHLSGKSIEKIEFEDSILTCDAAKKNVLGYPSQLHI